MPIIQDISAGLTDYARELIARGLAEAVMLGDWSFQVGTYGFLPLFPDQVYPVDFSLQSLTAPVGGTRLLGELLDTGFGASVALTATPGILQVNGLTASTVSMAKKWLGPLGLYKSVVEWNMGGLGSGVVDVDLDQQSDGHDSRRWAAVMATSRSRLPESEPTRHRLPVQAVRARRHHRWAGAW